MYGNTSKNCLWGVKVEYHLNVKIIDAIMESEYEKPIKDFLIRALLVEFRKIDQTKPRVKEDYEALIKTGTAEMRAQK